MPDDMSMMGGAPPMPPQGGQGGDPTAQALGQLSSKGGKDSGSLLQLILTFLAGAGLRDVVGSMKQVMGGGKSAKDKGKQMTGPGAPPPMAAMPPGAPAAGGQPGAQQLPPQLQQILMQLMAKSQGQPPNPQGM